MRGPNLKQGFPRLPCSQALHVEHEGHIFTIGTTFRPDFVPEEEPVNRRIGRKATAQQRLLLRRRSLNFLYTRGMAKFKSSQDFRWIRDAMSGGTGMGMGMVPGLDYLTALSFDPPQE